MDHYQTAAAIITGTGLAFSLGIWAGAKIADAEWKEIIDTMRRNPNLTKQELIFRLDQRK
ncbi:MAG: hypothetical protein ACR2IJ_02400 [Fluviibacter sp.]